MNISTPVLSNAEGFILTSPEHGRRSEAEGQVPTATLGPNAQPETRNAQRRRRGAPKGNTNARVHGCRSPRIVEAQRKILEQETTYGRLDREILLTLWQLAMVNACGATLRVVLRLNARLARLVRTRYGVHLDDLDALENACQRAMIDLPLTKELVAKLAAPFSQPPVASPASR